MAGSNRISASLRAIPVYSEKPDEYSKPSESCQANEIFEDSLFPKVLKIPVSTPPLLASKAKKLPIAIIFWLKCLPPQFI
jgi:hypothetical protein